MGLGSLIKKAWNATFNVGPDAKDMYITKDPVGRLDRFMDKADKHTDNRFMKGLYYAVNYNPLGLLVKGLVKGIDIASGESKFVDKYLDGVVTKIGNGYYGGLVSGDSNYAKITIDNTTRGGFPNMTVPTWRKLAKKLHKDIMVYDQNDNKSYFFGSDGFFKNLR